VSTPIDVHQGWLSPSSRPGSLTARTGSPAEDEAFARALVTLSKRERQMLRLRAQGLTIVEICERCFLGDSTVKAHLQSAFRKLDLHDLRDRGKCARACYLLGRHDAGAEGRRE
jgi:DNA-binding NarL/FixJ family response regulator